MKENKHPIRKSSIETHRKCNQQLNPTELTVETKGKMELEGGRGAPPKVSKKQETGGLINYQTDLCLLVTAPSNFCSFLVKKLAQD